MILFIATTVLMETDHVAAANSGVDRRGE